MISVVCVYNDKAILKDYLLKSLESQTLKHESILINNTRGSFKSAAEALNYGGGKAKGEYIIFVHQDVDLRSSTWLEEAERTLDCISNLGIGGVAGARKTKSSKKLEVITNIKHGIMPRNASNVSLRKPEVVQTVDECLVVIPKSLFKMLKFDEKTCDDWHLYAVDYSLNIKNYGLNAYTIPMFVYHRSAGFSFSKKYYQTLRKLLKKHKERYRQIYTTMGNWSTRYPLFMQRKFIRQSIKHMVKKI